MSQLLRRSLIGIASLIALLLVLALCLVLLIDPNDFRDQLSRSAARQGIALQLEGDLGWQFWPQLGITAAGVSVADLRTPDQPIASLESFNAMVRIGPLLRGQVQIDGLHLEGVRLNLVINPEGQGNWQALTASPTTGAGTTGTAIQTPKPTIPNPKTSNLPEAQPGDERVLTLAVETLAISDAELALDDRQRQQKFQLSGLRLRSSGVNLDGGVFPLTLDFNASSAQPSINLGVALETRLSVNLDKKALTLSDSQLQLSQPGSKSTPLQMGFNLQAEAGKSLAYKGDLHLTAQDLRAWLNALAQAPQTRNPKVLQQLALNTRFSGNDRQLQLQDLELQLDQTHLLGSAAVNDFDTAAVGITLKGDRIDLDDYLPPPAQASAAPAEGGSITGAATEAGIPLEPLRTLAADVQLEMAQITASGLHFDNSKLHLLANQGLIRLRQLGTDFYSGRIDASGNLDARGKQAKIDLQSEIKSVQLAGLLKDLQRQEQLTGTVNANLNGNTQGIGVSQLFQALSAKAEITAEALQLHNINLEQEFCQAAAQLSGKTLPATEWAPDTQLRNVRAQLSHKGGITHIDTLTAGVEQLQLGSRGQLDHNRQRYDLWLPMTLTGETSSDNGCKISNRFVRDRELALVRCRGSLEAPEPGRDCGIDKKAFNRLLGDYAKYKARKKVDKKKEQWVDKAREKFGDDASELLKGLLK